MVLENPTIMYLRTTKNKEVPPARPGVREVTDGVFLYTTRVTNTATAGGPTFIYEVSAAGYFDLSIFWNVRCVCM